MPKKQVTASFPFFVFFGWFNNYGQPPCASPIQNSSSFSSPEITPSTGLAASSQADVARKMMASMPDRAKQIIFDGDFGGSQLVMLTSDIHRPSFKDPFFKTTCMIKWFFLGMIWQKQFGRHKKKTNKNMQKGVANS